MSKFILGAGISGLIWKFYNPDFEVISPIQVKDGLPTADPFVRSSMIWLHDCPQTRQFLIDLGWQNPEDYIRQSRIGYYDRGVIKDNLTPELKQVLVDKKMTPWQKEIKRAPVSAEDSVRLSLTGNTEGANFMNVIGVSHGEIMYRLKQRTEVTHGYVGKITHSTIGVTNEPPREDSGYVYSKYDTIVSTIPMNHFWRAWFAGHSDYKEPSYPELNSLPITFAVVRKRPAEFDGNYEMVYYDDTTPFTRISFLNNKYCIEFTGDMSRETFCKMYPELSHGLFDFWQLPQGRIISREIQPPDNVIFSGRFATWNHSVTTEHVIDEAMQYAQKRARNDDDNSQGREVENDLGEPALAEAQG